MPIRLLKTFQQMLAQDPGAKRTDQLEELINRLLAKDEKTIYRLRELGNCSIGFALRGTSLSVVVSVRDGHVGVVRDVNFAPDVQIEGSISDFVAMANSQREEAGMTAGKVSIQGDLATAQNVQTIISNSNFDFEDFVSARVGDVLGRQIGRTVRGGFQWARNSHRTIEQDVSEYLKFETRVLPTEREIEEFIRCGAAVSTDVDRLQARLERVRRQRQRP